LLADIGATGMAVGGRTTKPASASADFVLRLRGESSALCRREVTKRPPKTILCFHFSVFLLLYVYPAAQAFFQRIGKTKTYPILP
jgi:hypothetical protein